MLTKSDYQHIYKLLEGITPLTDDCGKLCDKHCCTDWNDGVGMYLLPGEEVMFSKNEDWLVFEKHSTDDYEFPPSWEGDFYFVQCIKSCPREKRPFECRTYPLIPFYNEETGQFELTLNPAGKEVCPLVDDYRIADLNPEFVQKVEAAWKILLKDPLILEDIIFRSKE